MESNRDTEGQLTPLARKNIDTGLGLERMAQILQRVPNNYETDLILPIVDKAAELAGMQYASASATDKTALKVVTLEQTHTTLHEPWQMLTAMAYKCSASRSATAMGLLVCV